MTDLLKFFLVLALIGVIELGLWILCCVLLRRMRREKGIRP